ncbi:hypothetical protein FH972_014992 [Carpinus fangiana]|uniref:Uncharacterized protein n=1 Tax=Carpinus fangiana TaxID=176857 RepID=A0A5N6RBR0_9ROSI|nr:hypothetical protein FH972_014992 [Carpinus fangiana]
MVRNNAGFTSQNKHVDNASPKSQASKCCKEGKRDSEKTTPKKIDKTTLGVGLTINFVGRGNHVSQPKVRTSVSSLMHNGPNGSPKSPQKVKNIARIGGRPNYEWVTQSRVMEVRMDGTSRQRQFDKGKGGQGSKRKRKNGPGMDDIQRDMVPKKGSNSMNIQ